MSTINIIILICLKKFSNQIWFDKPCSYWSVHIIEVTLCIRPWTYYTVYSWSDLFGVWFELMIIHITSRHHVLIHHFSVYNNGYHTHDTITSVIRKDKVTNKIHFKPNQISKFILGLWRICDLWLIRLEIYSSRFNSQSVSFTWTWYYFRYGTLMQKKLLCILLNLS